MRIISNFRDYYDGIQGTAQDRSLTYLRYKSEVRLTDNKNIFVDYPINIKHVNGSYCYGELYLVGFCGTIYPAIKFTLHTGDDDKTEVCYNMDQIESFLLGYSTEVYDYFVNHKQSSYHSSNLTKDYIEEIYDVVKQHQRSWQHYFKTAPVFVVNLGDSYIVFNERLREFQFYRKFNVYQTFQELSMFLGNQAAPHNPIPKVSDEVMAEIKGFDKWSFRKEPTKRRSR